MHLIIRSRHLASARITVVLPEIPGNSSFRTLTNSLMVTRRTMWRMQFTIVKHSLVMGSWFAGYHGGRHSYAHNLVLLFDSQLCCKRVWMHVTSQVFRQYNSHQALLCVNCPISYVRQAPKERAKRGPLIALDCRRVLHCKKLATTPQLRERDMCIGCQWLGECRYLSTSRILGT